MGFVPVTSCFSTGASPTSEEQSRKLLYKTDESAS